jgi:2-oxoisovalerate dehydrogenase E1 component
MTVESASAVEIAEGHRSALDYPNIRAYEIPPGQLAATPRRTLALGLFMLHVIRQFERWLLDHADLVHGPLHSSIGQEAVAVGTALALEPADRLSSTHRAHHDVLAKLIAYAAPADFDPVTAAEVPAAVQETVLRTFAEILGLEQGMCRGRGGSMHLADVDGGITTSAIVGGGIPVSAGQALAAKLRGDGSVSLASFGDGATSIGAFHESAVLARSWRLPMIFLLENNQYAVATSLRETAGFEELAIRSSGYDMPALIVDGMDPIAVLTAMTAARAHATSEGPVFVEATTYRYYHQNGPLPGSAYKYRTKDEEQRWAALDPVAVFPRKLLDAGLMGQDELDHVAGLARGLIEACAGAVTEETADGLRIPPTLYPSNADAGRGMLGPGVTGVAPELLDTTPVAGAPEITYGAAVSGVIARWLERDPEAFVLGEEVGHLGGGVMGLTKGAIATAPDRVISTPICENGFTGAAFGAALSGMHPIVEFMYPDFTLEAADQLFNHIPKARYMYGGIHRVPLVVRTQISRGRGYGPQHGADPAALFALFPGWRIASPSTAAEYVGLFNAAMLSGDPVLVLDDHRLVRTTAALPPGGMDHVIPPGVSRLVRDGRDATVVTWGYGLGRVLAVADGLAGEGISLEIIDPRWLDRASFDRAGVLASVARTGKLVIVEDAQRTMSMGGLILDYLLPDLFEHLRAAPVRVTGEDVYSPVSKPLETFVLLRDESIEGAIRSVVAAPRQGGVAR